MSSESARSDSFLYAPPIRYGTTITRYYYYLEIQVTHTRLNSELVDARLNSFDELNVPTWYFRRLVYFDSHEFEQHTIHTVRRYIVRLAL